MSYNIISYNIISYHTLIHKYHSISYNIKYNDMMKEIICSHPKSYEIKLCTIKKIMLELAFNSQEQYRQKEVRERKMK